MDIAGAADGAEEDCAFRSFAHTTAKVASACSIYARSSLLIKYIFQIIDVAWGATRNLHSFPYLLLQKKNAEQPANSSLDPSRR